MPMPAAPARPAATAVLPAPHLPAGRPAPPAAAVGRRRDAAMAAVARTAAATAAARGAESVKECSVTAMEGGGGGEKWCSQELAPLMGSSPFALHEGIGRGRNFIGRGRNFE